MNNNVENIKILDLLNVLRTFLQNVNINPQQLAQLLQAVTPLFDNNPEFNSVENTIIRLEEVLNALKAFVEVTKSETDDLVIEFIDSVLANQNVKTILATVLYHFLRKDKGENVQRLTAEDWSKIMKLLELLWELFKVLSGNAK